MVVASSDAAAIPGEGAALRYAHFCLRETQKHARSARGIFYEAHVPVKNDLTLFAPAGANSARLSLINKLYVIETASVEPYHNLALEKALFDRVEQGELILYLWQNRRTVVCGRNQNVYQECRISQLKADGGYLARRLSGGGAVFHDLGNLNFTFLAREGDYDLDRQLGVIQAACAAQGIPAQRSGRNDLTVEGRKFSGNAFHASGGRKYHHGTLMVDVVKEDLQKYLNVDPEKLKSKGVASVRSRVCNLTEFCPGLTVGGMKDALRAAFSATFGLPYTALAEEALGDLREKAAFFGSDRWLYGPAGSFTLTLRRRFPWGEADIRLDARCGAIRDAAVYSDAMDGGYIRLLAENLPGTELSAQAVAELAENLAETDEQKAMAADIRALILDTL